MLTLKRLFGISPSGAEINVKSCILTSLFSEHRKNICRPVTKRTGDLEGTLIAVINYTYDPEHQMHLSGFSLPLSSALKINVGVQLIIFVNVVHKDKV